MDNLKFMRKNSTQSEWIPYDKGSLKTYAVVSLIGVSLTLIVAVGIEVNRAKNYPQLRASDCLQNEIIVEVKRIGSATRFTLSSGRKFLCAPAYNKTYEDFPDFCMMLFSGDELRKKCNSDSIYVTKSEKVYFFRLYQSMHQ